MLIPKAPGRHLYHPLGGLVIVGWLSVVGCTPSATPPAPPPAAVTGPVTIEVKDGDRVTVYKVDGVAEGTTLETVMRSLDQVPVTITGSGISAFVQGIGDRHTSGGEGWTFLIDGQFANAGIGSTTLHPPTTVSWSYGAGEGF